MRKLIWIVLGGLVVLLLVGVGLLSLVLHQLADPASGTSTQFTASFVEKCVAVAQQSTQPSQGTDGDDNIKTLCSCGADDMREDLADAGIGGVAHMILIEGIDAKMQRVMDACQTTPSAP